VNVIKQTWAALQRAAVREPVQIAGFLAMVTQFVSAQWLPLTINQQGALNAAVVAFLGFVAATAVSEEKAMPAFAGLIQAGLAVGLAFDLHLPPNVQAVVMAFVSAVGAWFVRTQVGARGGPPGGRHEASAIPDSLMRG